MENGSDRSPKIVEIDTCCRPKSRSSRRTSPFAWDASEEFFPPNSVSSPLPCHVPARIAVSGGGGGNNCRNYFPDYECRLAATAQSTPRYLNQPATPAKSVCGGDYAFRRSLNAANCPSYMANTQSFEAKVRSQSAPKQRPEPGSLLRKRLPLSEVMVESRASLSGVGMQRSCANVQEAFDFKSAVVGRLDNLRSKAEWGREPEKEKELYLFRKW